MASFRGYPACSCLAEWLPVYEDELLRLGLLKWNLDVYQLLGWYSKSGGTHSEGGAFDLAQFSDAQLKIARSMGADADWHRRRAQGFDVDHAHGVLRGCPHNGPARYQIDAVDDGYNGLGWMGRGGKDDGPRPLSGRTYKQGIAWAKKRQEKAKIIPTAWYVHVDRLFAYKTPYSTSVKNLWLYKNGNRSSVGHGGLLMIHETKVVYGTLWGRTSTGKWWILGKGRAAKTRPSKRYTYEPVGFIKVASVNAAAQAQRAHQASWLSGERPTRILRDLAALDVDVVVMQESGSGEYLDALEDAADNQPELLLVNGGKNWRQTLRNPKRTKWIAGTVLNLDTTFDSDGNQVQCVAFEAHRVRCGVAHMHVDVTASPKDQAAQVTEALSLVLGWFTSVDVKWINVTFAGDFNNRSGEVKAALAARSFVPAIDVADTKVNAGLRTTNAWSPGSSELPPGENGIDMVNVRDGVEVTNAANHVPKTDPGTDHNYVTATRAVYSHN